MKRAEIKSYTYLLLCATIWGFAFVAQSVAMDYMGPMTFTAARFWLGGLALIPVIKIIDKKNKVAKMSREERRTLLKGGVICGVFLATASLSQQYGIQTTAVGKAGFITTFYIVLVPIAGMLIGRRPGVRLWIGVAVALVALYLLCVNTQGLSLDSISIGDALLVLCAVLFTGQIMAIDHFSPKVDCVRLSCCQFFVVAILTTIPAIIIEKPEFASLIRGAVPLCYAGIMSSGVAYTFQILGQRDANASIAALIMSLESVFSVLAGWMILGQSLSAYELTGCALMFAAVVLAQTDRQRA